MKIAAFAVSRPASKVKPFVYEKNIGTNEMLIKISHCAIATGDIQMMDNAWGDSKFPLVPGHEIIGIVVRRGSAVAGFKNGDRVGVGYQLSACFHCRACKQGNEQFCRKQKVIGVDFPGGLAEHIVVDNRFAFKIPRHLDSAKAAPLMSSGLTVYAAIARAKLSKNSKVAVLGVGGLGHLAIQFLHKMGHDVSAFSRTTKKKALIQSLGGVLIDTVHAGENKALIGNFDFILSTLNTHFDINLYLRMLSPQGKFCVVAQPPDASSINLGILYDYAQRTVYGNYTGSRKDMRSMLAFASRHGIESIVEVMPFSQMNAAIDRVRSGNVHMRMVLQNTD